MEEERRFRFTMGDRFVILGSLMPKEGEIKFMRTSKNLRELLLPTEQEEKDYEFAVQNDQVVWKKELKDKTEEFQITGRAVEMIRDGLKRLNSSGKITEEHVDLWDMFDMDKE